MYRRMKCLAIEVNGFNAIQASKKEFMFTIANFIEIETKIENKLSTIIQTLRFVLKQEQAYGPISGYVIIQL